MPPLAIPNCYTEYVCSVQYITVKTLSPYSVLSPVSHHIPSPTNMGTVGGPLPFWSTHVAPAI